MTQNTNQKHNIYLNTNSLYGNAMSKFLTTAGFEWRDPKQCNMIKYTDWQQFKFLCIFKKC